MNGFAIDINKNTLIMVIGIALLGITLAILGTNFSYFFAFGVLIGILMVISIFMKPESGLYFIAAVIPIGRFTMPGLPFNFTLADGLIIIALFSWILRKLAYEKKYRLAKDKLFIFLSIFAVFSGLSLYNCQDKLRGSIELVQTIEYFIIIPYLFFDLIKNTKQIKGILWTMVIASAFFAPWGIYEAVVKGIRATSIAGHPNAFGIYLAMLIPIAYVLLLDEKHPLKRLFLIGLLVILGLALMATISRAGWLAATFSLLIVNYKKGIKKTATLSLVIMILVGILVAFYIPNTVSKRIKTITEVKTETAGGRLEQYKNALNMIKSHPFLGVGINEAVRYNIYREKKGSGSQVGGEIHNFYLSTAAERGLFAFFTLLGFIFLHLKRLNKLVNLRLGSLSNLSLICLTSSLGFLLGNLFHNSIGRGNGNMFMMIVGVALVLESIYRHPTVREK